MNAPACDIDIRQATLPIGYHRDLGTLLIILVQCLGVFLCYISIHFSFRDSGVSSICNSMSFPVQHFPAIEYQPFLISGVFCSSWNCTIIFRPKLHARFNSIDPTGGESSYVLFYWRRFLTGCRLQASRVLHVVEKVKRRIGFFFWLLTFWRR